MGLLVSAPLIVILALLLVLAVIYWVGKICSSNGTTIEITTVTREPPLPKTEPPSPINNQNTNDMV